MGFISNPWRLVVLVIMMSVAAMVHSSDDMDVMSVNEDNPEPREGDTNDPQASERSSMELLKDLKRSRRREGYLGVFKTTLKVHDHGYAGTHGGVLIQVKYKSGKTWGSRQQIAHYVWSDETYHSSFRKTYYGKEDQVKEVLISKTTVDAFFPDFLTLDGPEDCDTYDCKWTPRCMKWESWWWSKIEDYRDCYIYYQTITVPCAGPRC